MAELQRPEEAPNSEHTPGRSSLGENLFLTLKVFAVIAILVFALDRK